MISRLFPALNVLLTPIHAHTMHFFSCPDYGYTVEKDNAWKHLFYGGTIYKEKCFDEVETLKKDIRCSARVKKADFKLSKNSSSPSCWSIFFQYQQRTALTLEIQRLRLHKFCPVLFFCVFTMCILFKGNDYHMVLIHLHSAYKKNTVF